MMTFELKQEHLTLLQHAYVGWNDCESGAPEIDPKRPYGNSSVELDVAEILGIAVPPEMSADQRTKLFQIHAQTQHALAIVLQHIGKPVPLGIYVNQSGPYHRPRWVRREGAACDG